MEELITRLTEKLGIPTEVAERVIGAVFSMFDQNGSADVSALIDQMPGARDLIQNFSDGDAAAGGAGGGIGGMLSGAMSAVTGGNPLMDTLGKLQAEGLSVDQARTAGTEIVGFAREKLGDEQVETLISSIPGLKGMI